MASGGVVFLYHCLIVWGHLVVDERGHGGPGGSQGDTRTLGGSGGLQGSQGVPRPSTGGSQGVPGGLQAPGGSGGGH
eukprot:5416226-Prymnesium_polylepis.3